MARRTQKDQQGWKAKVRRWYAAYSEHEKLLVLHTHEGMIKFISSLLRAVESKTRREERERAAEVVTVQAKKYLETGNVDEDACHFFAEAQNQILNPKQQ